MLKDNIAQILVLEMSAPHPASRRQLVVANTHINASPEFADVKLWQTHMLVKELEKFTISRQLPLVLCGDLNSSTTTAVHHLLAGTRGGNS